MSTRTFDEIHETYRHARQTSNVEQLSAVLDELAELNTTEAIALAKRTQATMLSVQGSHSASLEYFFEAYSLYEENGDNVLKAVCTNEIALIFHITGELAKALEWMHRALDSHSSLGNLEGVAAVTNNIGMIFNDTGDYAKALDYYHRALTMHLEIGNRIYQANTTGNLARVYREIGDLSTALDYAQRALSLQQEVGNRSGESSTMTLIGALLTDMEQLDDAQTWIRRAIVHANENGLSHLLPTQAIHLAFLLYKMKRFDEAITVLDDNSSLIEQHATALTDSMTFRADILADSGDPVAARELLLIALEQSTKRNARAKMMEITKSLRDISKTLGDLDSYVKYNESYQEIANEVSGAESTRRLTMQEKEREIEVDRQSRAREQEAQERERDKERSILYGALPQHVAERLIRGEKVTDHYDNASVMFIDIVGFTRISSHVPAGHVVHLLDAIFGACDEICQKYDITKIKTIGDSYMAFSEIENSEYRIAKAAIEIQEYLATMQVTMPPELGDTTWTKDIGDVQVRVGLHSGPVVAGIVGRDRLQYDVWGDTVNIASRMESSGEPGRIHVSEQFANALSPLSAKERGLGESSRETLKERGLGESSRETLKERGLGESSRETLKERGPGESSHVLTLRGSTEIKGKGTMQTYWLSRNA